MVAGDETTLANRPLQPTSGDDANSGILSGNPQIMGGTPVFVGTRVPFQTLLDYLEPGDPLAEFLEDFLRFGPTKTSKSRIKS